MVSITGLPLPAISILGGIYMKDKRIFYCAIIIAFFIFPTGCNISAGNEIREDNQNTAASEEPLADEESSNTLNDFQEYLGDIKKIHGFRPYYRFVFAFEQLKNGALDVPVESVQNMLRDLNETFNYVVVAQHPLNKIGYYDGDIEFVEDNGNKGKAKEYVNIKWYDIDGNPITTTPLKTVLLGESVIENFDNRVYEGRNLQLSDFSIKSPNDPINIVLGNIYKEIYKIGDVIQLELISDIMNFEVVGFYKENTKFSMDVGAQRLVDFDYAIVMPFVDFEYEPDSKASLYQHGFLAAEKTSGYIAISEEIEEIDDIVFDRYSKQIENLAEKNGLGGFYRIPYYPVGFVW